MRNLYCFAIIMTPSLLQQTHLKTIVGPLDDVILKAIVERTMNNLGGISQQEILEPEISGFSKRLNSQKPGEHD
ncbi:hypothetical protein [Prevotella sp. P6B1]|uniref:hypothetical protein n=1 Tax=Prevotella sp. P6B1 TaxID=1410613 RepID=UPI0018CC256B|nr:hypothetical protein [Prevotella sp. P6B1]